MAEQKTDRQLRIKHLAHDLSNLDLQDKGGARLALVTWIVQAVASLDGTDADSAAERSSVAHELLQ
jgi:hypothetical protein